jgi:uncharacterized protein (TIGR02453 family)
MEKKEIKSKICSRGHHFEGSGPCPVCWPGRLKKKTEQSADVSPVFTAELLRFLKDIKQNNNPLWFQDNKLRYEKHVRLPLTAFGREFIPRLLKVAPAYGETRIFRIYRDVRFSKDKTPYKTHASIQFLRSGSDRDVHQPGFYLHLEPGGESFFGAGIWAPEPDVLEKIRTAIVTKPALWAPLSKYPFWGESYVRPPKDVDPDHRFIKDLMRKHFLTWVDFKDSVIPGPKFMGLVEKACRETAPLVAFLDRALGFK